MNRKDLIVSIVAASIALAGSPASAELYTYDFTDVITWPGDGQLIQKSAGPFTYIHVISDTLDFSAGQLVTDATLTLTFYDDEPDGGAPNNEITKVGYWNGTGWLWQNIGDVDTGNHIGPEIDVSWLNAAGQLQVGIDITNSGGDVYLQQSVLGVTALVPLGPAVVLGVLGFAVAGWKLRRFV